MRKLILAPLFAAAVALGAPGVAMAAPNNDQDGLVNVNLQEIDVLIPVAVAVPISVAANVCGVSILSLHEDADMACDATSNSLALSRAFAVAATDPNGGGANNQQSGLINVNVQDVLIEIPASVAVPVGIAANVCGVSVLSLHQQTDMTCDAETTSTALTQAIARALAGQ